MLDSSANSVAWHNQRQLSNCCSMTPHLILLSIAQSFAIHIEDGPLGVVAALPLFCTTQHTRCGKRDMSDAEILQYHHEFGEQMNNKYEWRKDHCKRNPTYAYWLARYERYRASRQWLNSHLASQELLGEDLRNANRVKRLLDCEVEAMKDKLARLAHTLICSPAVGRSVHRRAYCTDGR